MKTSREDASERNLKVNLSRKLFHKKDKQIEIGTIFRSIISRDAARAIIR